MCDSFLSFYIFIKYYDSKIKYPQFFGPEHEYFHFTRWELRVENLTHTNREILVEKLESLNLHYNNTLFNIYSES